MDFMLTLQHKPANTSIELDVTKHALNSLWLLWNCPVLRFRQPLLLVTYHFGDNTNQDAVEEIVVLFIPRMTFLLFTGI